MSEKYQLENNSMIVQISENGAEVKKIFSKAWGRDILWEGDDKTWNRSAPLLFPIVGKLTDNEYILKSKKFTMTQHGFARDSVFKCINKTDEEIILKLMASQETFKSYPFCFELKVKYQLKGNSLNTHVIIINDDRQDILFSIGAHPGFSTLNIGDYEIHFEATEKEYFRLSHGQVDWEKATLLNNKKIELSPQLFKEDALIFTNLKSQFVDLVNTKWKETIRVHSKVPYWGIWGKSEVPFVCLEPWNGIADTLNHQKDFEEKEGIIRLPQGESFEFNYVIELI
jgi:galactose mutarotase-like enzyme